MTEMLCRPRGESWIDAPGYATEDRRLVNPGSEDNAPLTHNESVEKGAATVLVHHSTRP